MSVRLNKFLADRGIASRRASDRMIEDGRVRINGRVVTELGTKVEELRDRVSVDGKPIGGRERHVYFVLNKPVGVITTLNDPEGRRTVRELLPRGARVYPVGRLDADTSGLLLLTNDGDLAHRLMHPRYGVAKVYRVRLAREPRPEQMRRLAGGVRFDRDLVSGPARARRIDPGFDAIMIELVVHEGRFRQVRKMCEAVGLEVTGLHRVGYGPIRLGPLARGMFRELSDEEVAKLKAESARAGGSGRGEGPARERPASRPRPVAAATQEEDGEEDAVEDTWIPGGGFLEPEADDEEGAPAPRPRATTGSKRRSAPARPAEWPARATERRGDDDWRPAERRPVRAGGGRREPRRSGDSAPSANRDRRRPGAGAPSRSRDWSRAGGDTPSRARDGRRTGSSAPPRNRFGGPGQRTRGQQGPRANGAGGTRRPRERAGRIAERRVPRGGTRANTRNPSRRKPR